MKDITVSIDCENFEAIDCENFEAAVKIIFEKIVQKMISNIPSYHDTLTGEWR